MRMIWRLAALVVFLLPLLSGTAQAHSTKGRLKVDLRAERPTVDDFAYFMESYVHTELYRDRYGDWEKRFYVKSFSGIEFERGQAVVHFIRLDTKEKQDRAESMTFTRGKDGVWQYADGRGGNIRVYTYVMKWRYYYERYILPGSAIGLFVVGGGYGVFWLGRRRRMAAIPPVQAL